MEYTTGDIFARTSLLVGEDVVLCAQSTHVAVFGIGGVGSWCAEGLVRSGIGELTIVDSDTVSVSNINRQLMATVSTVGMDKTEALGRRLLDINPQLRLHAIRREYCERTADSFNLNDFDYIIDAIDTQRNKILLIRRATAARGVFYSSMGAALKVDPCRVHVANFWKVRDCPMGAALRKKIRQSGRIPERSFLCVYGDEMMVNRGETPQMREQLLQEAAESGHAVVNGTTAPVTAIFGMTLAGMVLRDIYEKTTAPEAVIIGD